LALVEKVKEWALEWCCPNRAEFVFFLVSFWEWVVAGGPSDQEEAYHCFRLGLALPEGLAEVEAGKGLPFECNLHHFNGGRLAPILRCPQLFPPPPLFPHLLPAARGMAPVCLFKGCYMGQELTARTFFTGEIRKRLLPLRLDALAEQQYGCCLRCGRLAEGASHALGCGA
jgi:hypothetical protein